MINIKKNETIKYTKYNTGYVAGRWITMTFFNLIA
jgi:phenolic acid decarboxylase